VIRIPESAITFPECLIGITGIGDQDPGISDHLPPESVITMVRNTQNKSMNLMKSAPASTAAFTGYAQCSADE
jgi:hypothetical protein